MSFVVGGEKRKEGVLAPVKVGENREEDALAGSLLSSGNPGLFKGHQNK